jgi:acyl-CoA thioester hydrolase
VSRGAAISIRRRVEWPDTDAAGHYHHSSVIRWVEAAEAELHESLDLPELFGTVPRVRYEVDYLDRLWFRDAITVELWVDHVGSSSLSYGFEVSRDGHGPAARGAMICVHSAPDTPKASPWPPEVAQRLRGDS